MSSSVPTTTVVFSHEKRDEVLEVVRGHLLPKGIDRDLPEIFFGDSSGCYLMNSKVMGKQLGKGAVGKVYDYTISKNGVTTTYAVKVVPSYIYYNTIRCEGGYVVDNKCDLRYIYDYNLGDSSAPPYDFVVLMNETDTIDKGKNAKIPADVEGAYECKTTEDQRSVLFGWTVTTSGMRARDQFDEIAFDIGDLDRDSYRRDFYLINNVYDPSKKINAGEVIMVPIKREDRYFPFPKGSYLCSNDTYVENTIALLCSSLVESSKCVNFIHTFDVSVCPTTQTEKDVKTGMYRLNQYIFMEKIHGTVKDLVVGMRGKMSAAQLDKQVRSIYIQTLFGVASMQHSYGIQHNDLHNGNVMYQNITPDLRYDSKRVKDCTHMKYDIIDTNGERHTIWIPLDKNTVIAKIGDFGYSVKYSHPIVGGTDTTTRYVPEFTGCFVQWEAICNDILYFTASMFHYLFGFSPFIRRMMSWLSDPMSVTPDRPEGVFTGMKTSDIADMYASEEPNPISRVFVTHDKKDGFMWRMNLNTYHEGGFSHVDPLKMILNQRLLGKDVFSTPSNSTSCKLGTVDLGHRLSPPIGKNDSAKMSTSTYSPATIVGDSPALRKGKSRKGTPVVKKPTPRLPPPTPGRVLTPKLRPPSARKDTAPRLPPPTPPVLRGPTPRLPPPTPPILRGPTPRLPPPTPTVLRGPTPRLLPPTPAVLRGPTPRLPPPTPTVLRGPTPRLRPPTPLWTNQESSRGKKFTLKTSISVEPIDILGSFSPKKDKKRKSTPVRKPLSPARKPISVKPVTLMNRRPRGLRQSISAPNPLLIVEPSRVPTNEMIENCIMSVSSSLYLPMNVVRSVIESEGIA